MKKLLSLLSAVGLSLLPPRRVRAEAPEEDPRDTCLAGLIEHIRDAAHGIGEQLDAVEISSLPTPALARIFTQLKERAKSVHAHAAAALAAPPAEGGLEYQLVTLSASVSVLSSTVSRARIALSRSPDPEITKVLDAVSAQIGKLRAEIPAGDPTRACRAP